jgi:hypothetical protein
VSVRSTVAAVLVVGVVATPIAYARVDPPVRQDLRGADARPTPEAVQDLRSPDARDAARSPFASPTRAAERSDDGFPGLEAIPDTTLFGAGMSAAGCRRLPQPCRHGRVGAVRKLRGRSCNSAAAR